MIFFKHDQNKNHAENDLNVEITHGSLILLINKISHLKIMPLKKILYGRYGNIKFRA